MQLGLDGKVVLVSGASKGLGYATALSFAREGARIAICSRNKDRITQAAEKIRKETNAEVFAMAADMTQQNDPVRFVKEAYRNLGSIHICITNIGGPPSMPFLEIEDDLWQQAFNLTFMSVVRLSRAVIPFMQKQQWGRILHLCGCSVKNPIQNLTLSNVIRPAVVALAKTQADQLSSYNILVNSLLTGWIKTERMEVIMNAKARNNNTSFSDSYKIRENSIPIGRIGYPEEVADTLVYLASERASFITGTTITVDGGETRFPF